MSEAQDIQSTESKENSDSEGSRPRSNLEEEKESSFDGYETPKSESTPTPMSDEPEKNVGSVNSNAKPPTNTTSGIADQQQQSKLGECNLLPVLVERLRSALELSCSSRCSEDQHPLEDSGVDSEEDLRNWASNLNTSVDQNVPVTKPKLDLKFLEELLLSDIQTALARLQDTLKRVDIGALTKYNSTLDPTNKLHLLRLISNLLAKLKIPEEAIKPQNPADKPHIQRRNRSERHTIGVSREELARARKWLDERNLSPGSAQVEFNFRNDLVRAEDPKRELEKSEIPEKLSGKTEKFPTDIEDKKLLEKQFGQVHEKYMKDAINQQQSLQNRLKEDSFDLDRLLENSEDCRQEDNFYQQPSVPKYNKFLAKKSRLKRANTIDIPNYLKLQSDTTCQNGGFSLRRPIDISDKVLSNGTSVIPSFQPKTDNDRKFLALINKNNDTGPPATSVPFKSFSYRQNSVADKNWNNRFSHIKTAFDKHQDQQNLYSEENNPQIDNRRKSMGNENEVVGSLKLSFGPAKKSNGFTHAPTSPFQKIEKLQKVEPPAFLKPGYISKAGSNLQAKVKMFNQEQNLNPPPPPPVRIKGKLTKNAENIFNINENESHGVTENGHINYQSFCKQFAPKGSNQLELARSKFTGDEVKNFAKDPTKKMPFSNYENGPFQKSKQKLLKMQQDDIYEPQKHYQKQYDVYPVNVNPTNSNTGYKHNQKSDQKVRNHPKQRFENVDQNRRRDFNKFCNEPDRSSIGVQAGGDCYRDKSRFKNSEGKRKSHNASVQTSELYDSSKKTNFNYPENQELRYPGYQNSDYYSNRRDSFEVNRNPLEAVGSLGLNRSDGSRRASGTSKMSTEFTGMPTEPLKVQVEPSKMELEFSKMSVDPSRMPLDPSRMPVNLSRMPLESLILTSDSSRLPKESSRLSSRSLEQPKILLEHPRYPEPPRPVEHPRIPLEQTGPPVPERFNYNNILLRNYKSDQTPRSKSSYYDYEESPVYVPPVPIRRNSLDKIPRPNYEESKPPEDEFLPNLEHIQNQDISPDGVVTRYASAIATVSSVPESPEPFEEAPVPKIPPYPEKLDIPRIEPCKESQSSFEEIQRHNLLQQNLSHRLQEQNLNKSPSRIPQEIQEIQGRHESPLFGDSKSPTSPSFLFGNKGSLKHGAETNEGRRTQEKISMFEEINHPPVKRHFRPLNVPRADLNPPRINIVNPSKVVQPKFKTERSQMLNSVSPVDSSDEYLMSCANKPSRNIVLTKSESWHQLAMSKNNLQVPPAATNSLLKPPKPKSPSSLRLSKQFEASSSSDNIKKMEERIQRYFQGSGGAPVEAKKEARNKRTLAIKRNSNSLMRSHTMPHLYDDKIFDESTDVEKAFDSLFKETTQTDNRY